MNRQNSSNTPPPKSKFLTTILTTVVATATTTMLDWAFARVEEYTIEVPIVTPLGITQIQLELQEKRGLISNVKYGE